MRVLTQPATWTLADLQSHLQGAIELELGTIPLYLQAYYSINTTNASSATTAVATAIVNVASEEMLHLELACNVLNAIGGTPVLTGSAAPTYPSVLGYIQPPLTLNLQTLSFAQLGTFLQIELPNWLDPFFDTDTGPENAYDSIGEFYDAIETGLNEVNQFLPASENTKQKTNNFSFDGTTYLDSVPVTDLQSAVNALTTIVEQGEGTSQTDDDQPSPEQGMLAHFYAFQSALDTMSGNLVPVYPIVPNPASPSWTYDEQDGNLLTFFDGCFTYFIQSLETQFNTAGSSLSLDPMWDLGGAVSYIMSQPYGDTGLVLAPRWLFTASLNNPTALQNAWNALTSAQQANTNLQALAKDCGVTVS